MKCQHCGTEPNNATAKKGLYVCCCYMLHKENGKYIQHHKDKDPECLNVEATNDAKIEMKINRYVKRIGKDDLILDNSSCIQVVTQKGAFSKYSYSTLEMSKKLFSELKKFGFIYLDAKRTKKANEGYETPFLFYYKFDIDKMVACGGYKVVK